MLQLKNMDRNACQRSSKSCEKNGDRRRNRSRQAEKKSTTEPESPAPPRTAPSLSVPQVFSPPVDGSADARPRTSDNTSAGTSNSSMMRPSTSPMMQTPHYMLPQQTYNNMPQIGLQMNIPPVSNNRINMSPLTPDYSSPFRFAVPPVSNGMEHASPDRRLGSMTNGTVLEKIPELPHSTNVSRPTSSSTAGHSQSQSPFDYNLGHSSQGWPLTAGI